MICLSERLWVVGNSVSPAYFAESRDVPLLQMAAPIFLSGGILLTPQVVDQMALYLKDASQEIFLPIGGKVAADEGWAVAVWVNAHPLEFLVALAAHSSGWTTWNWPSEASRAVSLWIASSIFIFIKNYL